MMEFRARRAKADELRYTNAPPMSAAITITLTPRAMTIRFLVKNLNVASPPNALEPDVDFVIHAFFDHILSNRIGHLLERRNRIYATRSGFGCEDLIVILAYFFIR